MDLSFDWHEEKALANLTKHGVSFEIAARVFLDPVRLDRYDGREDYDEDRFVTIGLVGNTELAVAYTMRGDVIRIISARQAARHEKHEYWKKH